MAGSLRHRKGNAPKPLSERELAIILGNPPKVAKAKLDRLGFNRTVAAITVTRYHHNAGDRGQRFGRQKWRPEEDAWLRKNFETATRSEVRQRFPNRAVGSVQSHANNVLKLRKEKRIRGRLRAHEHMDVIREIVQRAKDDGIALAALDRETGMRNSYWAFNWQRRKVQLDAIVKAVDFFGGQIKITIDWRDV